jgi:hypothetical protein
MRPAAAEPAPGRAVRVAVTSRPRGRRRAIDAQIVGDRLPGDYPSRKNPAGS